MSSEIAGLLVLAAGAYLAIGVAFAVLFVIRGAGRIDPRAQEGTWGFRLLILPAAATLWPWLLRRWAAGAGLPTERNAHRDLVRPEGRR